MEITLTNNQISLFKKWLEHFSNPNLDAVHTGIFAGVKYALEQLNLYESVLYENKEKTVFILEETIQKLIEKIEANKIQAMWNSGFASGIAWVLSEFCLY